MDEQYIGQIMLLPYTFVPAECALCDGTILNIQSNAALFSLIGTLYGGNGTSNFALPNMLGMEPVPNMKYYIAVQGIYPMRQ